MRRAAKVGGFVVTAGAAIAAVAWMLRDRLLKPTVVPLGPEEAPAFRVAPPASPLPPDADDLTAIKGIGPVFQARLASVGITRFSTLGETPPGRIADVAGVTEARAEEWVAQARSLS